MRFTASLVPLPFRFLFRFLPALPVATAAIFACALALPPQAQSQGQSEGDQQFADLGVCKLESSQHIEGCRLGYRTWGKLNADATNAILAPTWFTGTSAQLSDALVKTKFADPAKYFVIVVDALGDGVSSSPSNSTTQPRMSFPAFTTRDMVET